MRIKYYRLYKQVEIYLLIFCESILNGRMPAKVNFTQRMISDLKEMSYSDFSIKWNVSIPTIIKNVRKYDWQTLTGPDGLIKHRIIDGIENKRCGRCKKWFPATLENFYAMKSKPDGFNPCCKKCQEEKSDISNSKASGTMTGEMLSDLFFMGDKEFSIKWNVSRQWIIKERKVRKIKSFNNQHNLKEHKLIDGLEYKWCAKCNSWKLLFEFSKKKNNIDELKHTCKLCEKHYRKNNKEKISEYHKIWQKTERGKKSRSLTWKKQSAKKKDAYVYWSADEDVYIRQAFDHKCPYCGNVKDLELEHFIPIVLGGKTEPGNCYYSCAKCNRGEGGKFERMPLEWLIERFGISEGYGLYGHISRTLKEHYKLWVNPT